MEVILLGVKIYAFVNSLMFSAESYVAANKLTKPAWAIILGLGLVLQVLMAGSSPINLINLAFTIAAFVYLADVRPALSVADPSSLTIGSRVSSPICGSRSGSRGRYPWPHCARVARILWGSS